ncbi:BolA family transcriptional regulator [Laribacter hongkongensis]|jgi:BolA protein|uniref:BolA domain containing protein n=1 Tax=Laribacter hongkongensis TaxID=168471 RepID=A0A248LIX4_9NEIS|nr:BolA family protein [Laribacter hongkongensis]ASJ24707.1 BolA domain containing protein [Laribacter hongkongensis]MCG8991767.1 BolA family transcriptional regulator [Laribacter hongkongensis]MCG8998692.1 BolA family transcriptional regulator [Laribacter hongkongensis]MCG9000234.1 BolA family transcriptional regulator [Laribacter hongkongensis]MCG9004409.1 BolA family transcriptional regulator [Laribacter hongkongensis]
MSLDQLIIERLAPLAASELMLNDHSALHAGHAGNTGGGHYELTIVSPHFEGLRLIERHRLVNALVADLIPQQIHALSLKAIAPSER